MESKEENIKLLERMELIAREFLAKANQGKTDDPKYVIGFHRSFATSIDHIHLHAFQPPFKTW